MSCVGKLFTVCLNRRIGNFVVEYRLLGEEQAGFRVGYSTVDHIFTLHAIIEQYKARKKQLYCAFVDYRKAFDSVRRAILWSKFEKL